MTTVRQSLFTLAAMLAPLHALRADCQSAWTLGANANDTWGASYINSNPSFAFQREVADDFDFAGPITALYVSGFSGGPTGSPTPVDGVWVRFYEWTASGPGVLQSATFVTGTDPALGLDERPSAVQISLAAPFVATGKHFVSVQIDFTDFGSWDPWQANANAPRLSTGYVRVNGGAWGLYTPLFATQPLMADVALELFTTPSNVCAPWNALNVPTPGVDAGLVDVAVLANGEVWALGNNSVTVAATLNSYPFALRQTAGAWSIVDMPQAPAAGTAGSRTTLEALEALAPNDIWAAGAHRIVVNGGWFGYQIRADHWDGASWTTMNTPLPPTSGSAGYSGSRITGVKGFASNDVWFVGEWVGPYPGTPATQPALAMHWDGANFALVPTPSIAPYFDFGLEAVDGVAPNDVWAVGGGSDGDHAAVAYVVHWNGSSWTHVPAPLVGVSMRYHDVLARSTNDVWAVGEAFTASGYVGVVQRWNGTSWSNVVGAPASFTPSLFASGADLWLDRWRFDGASWTYEPVAGCDPFAGAGVLGGGAGRMFAVGAKSLPGRAPHVIERTPSCVSGSYCTSATTTNGCVPGISSLGQASASAASGFVLQVSSVEGQRSGLFFYGASGQTALPWAAGSTSWFCVKAPTQRLGLLSSGGTVGACDGQLASDWNAFLAAHPAALGSPRTAGQSFDAQAWFRDPPAPRSTNLSNALHFVLAP